jgi:hypothetical protein
MIFYLNLNQLFNNFLIRLNNNFGAYESLCDFAQRWQVDFQDPATPIMQGIINLHNHVMFLIIVIVIFVVSLLAMVYDTFWRCVDSLNIDFDYQYWRPEWRNLQFVVLLTDFNYFRNIYKINLSHVLLLK